MRYTIYLRYLYRVRYILYNVRPTYVEHFTIYLLQYFIEMRHNIYIYILCRVSIKFAQFTVSLTVSLSMYVNPTVSTARCETLIGNQGKNHLTMVVLRNIDYVSAIPQSMGGLLCGRWTDGEVEVG